ncbi:MAG: hypothetical protein P0Y56_14515 [Candidatus Andeanibacterium colombiense]|uniref:Terminase n=1 Tax=Candidatus Andeanibacterium colombiense TaxID=3121345 RepID=A0AAJ5X5J1_9SPHN|nr:MAG: hypothetical protein P0Y56_14515 [Sphingomonadaceae bacterium]
MSKKFSQARKAAFLSALRATGNQTLAAERAKVSRSWVQLHRSEDPAFRSAVELAVRQARDRLRAEPSRGVPGGAAYADGAELVVRGTGGSGGGKRVQVARSRLRQWTPRVEERFLAALAGSCNVTAACAEAGLTAASAYGHRGRWPAFARRWDAAVELGYLLLEGRLIEAAGNFFSAPEDEVAEPAAGSAITGMSVGAAIHLLHMHKHEVRGIGKRQGRPGRAPDREAVRASILAKIDAIERADDRREQARLRAAAFGTPALK